MKRRAVHCAANWQLLAAPGILQSGLDNVGIMHAPSAVVHRGFRVVSHLTAVHLGCLLLGVKTLFLDDIRALASGAGSAFCCGWRLCVNQWRLLLPQVFWWVVHAMAATSWCEVHIGNWPHWNSV